MKPREKAEELFYKYCELCADSSYPEVMAKKCALIAVDEILQANKVWYENSIPYKYWTQVKKEIENL